MATRYPGAEVFALKDPRRIDLYAFPNNDLTTDIDQIKHPPNRVAGSGIRFFLFPSAQPGKSIQGGRFSRPQEIEFDNSFDVLVRLLLVTHKVWRISKAACSCSHENQARFETCPNQPTCLTAFAFA